MNDDNCVLYDIIRYYAAFNDSQQKNIDIIYLKQTVLGLYQEIEQRRIFQVIKVQFFKESLFLTLKKNEGVDLVKGDEIRILDKSDGEILGIFEITEIRSTEYLAQNSKHVSPIWMGYVHQQVESTAPPNSLAIHYAKEVNNNG